MTFTGEDGSSKGPQQSPYRMTKTCPSCGEHLVLRQNWRSGEKFVGCNSYPRCKFHESFDQRYQEVLEHCANLENRLRALESRTIIDAELPPVEAVEESLSDSSDDDDIAAAERGEPWCAKCLTFHDESVPHAKTSETPKQERLDEEIDDSWFEEAYFSPPMTARRFLTTLLSHGPQTTAFVFAEGHKHGFSSDRLRDVRRDLGLRTERKTGTKVWIWSLPAAPKEETEKSQ